MSKITQKTQKLFCVIFFLRIIMVSSKNYLILTYFLLKTVQKDLKTPFSA